MKLRAYLRFLTAHNRGPGRDSRPRAGMRLGPVSHRLIPQPTTPWRGLTPEQLRALAEPAEGGR